MAATLDDTEQHVVAPAGVRNDSDGTQRRDWPTYAILSDYRRSPFGDDTTSVIPSLCFDPNTGESNP